MEFKCSQLGRSSLILNDFARSASLMKLEILDRPTKGQNASPDLSRSLRLGGRLRQRKRLEKALEHLGFSESYARADHVRLFSLLLHMSQYMCEGQFDLHTKSLFDNPVADEKNVSKPM